MKTQFGNTLALLLCLISTALIAQKGFVFSGGSVIGATASVHHSAGLMAFKPIGQNGLQLTQGIQQPAGCTDLAADEHDTAAIYEDGSCTYNNLIGCTNPVADNFSPAAQIDDGSCTFNSTTGCTDAAAINYDVVHIFEDGSCIYTGCTYQTASNYAAEASVDDGSCLFDPCGNCPGDLNTDGFINFGDLTLFLSVYNSACP